MFDDQIWMIEVIRRDRPNDCMDGTVDHVWDAVMQVWFVKAGMMTFHLPDSVATEWPATALDACALAITRANQEVRRLVGMEVNFGDKIESIKRNAERRLRSAGIDVDFVEMLHRTVEQTENIIYHRATLVYEVEPIVVD